VDDNEKFLKSIERSFIDETYTTLFVTGGKDALEIIKQQQVHVLVTDMRMPEMGGLELLKIVRKNYPDIVRIVLSGYTHITNLLEAVNDGDVFKFFTKPCKFEETLKPAILEALDYYNFYSKTDTPVGKLQ
jgi:CheY-like chemotaxis protein